MNVFAFVVVCFALQDVVLSLDVFQDSLSADGCGGKMYADVEFTKNITSPNYPGNYTANKTCTWLIDSKSETLDIQLKFVAFNTNGESGKCNNDSDNLEVYEKQGSSVKRSYTFCGSTLPGPIVSSYNTHLYLKFKSSTVGSKQGFKLNISVYQDPRCGEAFQLAEVNKTKVITSPDFPNKYLLSDRCSWKIKTSQPGQVVHLKFTSFELNGPTGFYKDCSFMLYHVLMVFNSKTTHVLVYQLDGLGVNCGSTLPADVYSSGRYLSLVFVSRHMLIGPGSYNATQGFRLEYTAVQSPPPYISTCGLTALPDVKYMTMSDREQYLTATSDFKYIQSPLFPNKYPSEIGCSWSIKTSSASKKVKFELLKVSILNHNCKKYGSKGSNSLEVYEDIGGKRLLYITCSVSNTTKSVVSSGKELSIQFLTGDDNLFEGNFAGFRARYKEVDVETASGGLGTGAIVGIVFGVIAAVCLIILGAFCYCKRSK